MKFAVIENEFGKSGTGPVLVLVSTFLIYFVSNLKGEIGVDEKIIPESVDEEVIEVMNGCIWCVLLFG